MPDIREEFLAHYEREVAVTRERIQMFKDGKLGLFSITADGQRIDETDQAIARDEAIIAQLLPLLDRVREELGHAKGP